MIREQLKKDLAKPLKKLRISPKKLSLEHPANPEHGDYSTNIAMQVKKKGFSTPLDLANHIVNTWRSFGLPDYVEKIQVAKPGFINIWLKNEALSAEIERVLKGEGKYGSSKLGKDKHLLLEHTSPDPIKTIHVGHLRNNFLGMSMARILEFQGFKVTKDCINNDRGTHVSRAMWGYLVFAKKRMLNQKKMVKFKVADAKIKKIAKKADWKKLLGEWFKQKRKWLTPKDLNLKSDHFDLVVYSLGARAEDLLPRVKQQVREMLVEWEKKEKKTRTLWKKIIRWSLEGYEVTYQRIGSVHDYIWHESKLYEGGKELVWMGVKKGIFRQLPDRAVLSDLGDYGLTNVILIKSDGTSLYHTYDLYLSKRKRAKFPSQLYIWDIGNDQILYLKQLYAMCEQLGIGKIDDYFHLNYGYVYLKGKGKMSSRRGMVIKADDLLDSAHQKAREIIDQSKPELRKIKLEKEKEEVAEMVGLAALKYGLLKFSREKDIQFDVEESVSLEGDSGPYLQYTFARCMSVLRKGDYQGIADFSLRLKGGKLKFATPTSEETALLRTIYKFPEVIQEAGENFAPNLICNFLFDLAQKYNLFYNKHPILKAENEELKNFRLALTAAVGQVLKNGLNLLGIEAPRKM